MKAVSALNKAVSALIKAVSALVKAVSAFFVQDIDITPSCNRRTAWRVGLQVSTLNPSPPHPTPYTLHPKPYTLHPTPYTLNPTPSTLHPKQAMSTSILVLAGQVCNPNPKAETRTSKPEG